MEKKVAAAEEKVCASCGKKFSWNRRPCKNLEEIYAAYPEYRGRKFCALCAGQYRASIQHNKEMVPVRRDEHMNSLWEISKKLSLGGSDAELQKALSTYTELLDLVDENSTTHNVCAILRNRAIAYRNLKQYDAALEDFAKELEISQRRGDYFDVMQCQKLIEETRERQRNAEIEASGGEKAAKFQAMEQQGRKIWSAGPDADEAFESLFADLENEDPDVRAQASRLLADSSYAVTKLISIYEENLTTSPSRASLAGRVLGRKAAKGSNEMMSAEIAQLMYGIAVSFIPCPCAHCGHFNRGIPAPPRGPMVPYYTQENIEGVYAVPVLCDKCGKEFFVVWDTDPRW